MRKHTFLLLLFLCVSVCTTAETRVDKLLRNMYENPKYVTVIAHRGDWRGAPENSLQGYQNCIDMGVDMVEIDLHKTKDGVLVIMHDGTLDRTSTGKGAISDYTYEELQKFYLKAGDGVKTRHKIPTLEEVTEEDSQEEKLEKEKNMYLEMLRQERADFENYKKRNATLSSSAFQNGQIEAVDKILPALDNFERALMGSEDSKDAFVVGVRMIYKQLQEGLSQMGVTEIEALGKEFDPEIMNAVMQVEAEKGQKSGVVCEVLQKGYKTGDKIIRHAMVKVTM